MAVIETAQRFSRSRLWRLQRAYFERAGLSAFSTATVPHYITSNTVIADAYARVVLGWLLDQLPELDRAAPVYLIEGGAGSGRFAFLFLQRLTALLETAGLSDLRFTYVLTDFSDGGFAAWRAHPAFAPFFAKGQLDVARFDVERDTTIVLEVSGVTLAPGALKNPLVFLANYFFDSIPIDVFLARGGELYEMSVALTSPRDEPDLDDPTLLQRIELSYTERATPSAYYGDAEIDRLLELYRTQLRRTAVRFPIGALRCCQVFSALSAGRWLLVSADKGAHQLAALEDQPAPAIAVHGSFSMSVNYHAVGELFAGRGGELRAPDHPHSGITIVSAVMGPSERRHWRLAYAAAIQSFGPDDYVLVRRALEGNAVETELPALLGLLRLGQSDPRLLATLLTPLRKKLQKASATLRAEAVRLVDLAWANYFHIGEAGDFAATVGVLLCDLGEHARAIERFQFSLRWHGDDASTYYNLALCEKRLGHLDKVRGLCERAVALRPGHQGALGLIAELDRGRSMAD